MKIKFPIFFIVLSLLLTSCVASLSGMITNSAALGNANFTYVKKNIQGTSKATYILGIGGMAREALAQEAKANMLESTPLKANQAIANVIIDYKVSNTFLGIVLTQKCTVSADVVEFSK